MKKSLIGIAVALAAFFGGTAATKIFRFEQKAFSMPVVEAVILPKDTAPVPEISEIAEEMPAEEISADEGHISGWYQLDDYKKMDEVIMISLYKDDSGSAAGVFTTFENAGDEGVVDERWAEVTDKKAKFRTNKIKGIEYRFEGTFFKNKTIGADGEKFLRGTLQKFVKGRKIAEVTGDFAYYEPHCWH